MSLLLGTARLCKCSVRRRARLSRLLTGRRVHNMSPTQPASQPAASRDTDREQRGDERERGWGGYRESKSKSVPPPPSSALSENPVSQDNF